MKINKDWLIAALIRAIKTFAQVALSMFTIGMTIAEVKWFYILSVSAVAGVYSLLTSLAGLPEVGIDGTILVDTNPEEGSVYLLELNDNLNKLAKRRIAKFSVSSVNTKDGS